MAGRPAPPKERSDLSLKRIAASVQYCGLYHLLDGRLTLAMTGQSSFFLGWVDVKLVNQPVQVAPCHSQAACALGFSPAAFPQRPNQQSALELADFFFIRSVEGLFFRSAANDV